MPSISNNGVSSNAAIESVLAARQGAVQSQVAFSVAAKAQDAQQAAGDAAVALLESAAQLASAQLGQAAGLGDNFDAIG